MANPAQSGGGFVRKKREGVKAEINVTPLVDVVLVLLIIYMVVTPLIARHFTVQVPPEEKTKAVDVPKDDEQLVVRMDEKGVITLNSEVVDIEELKRKLVLAFNAKAEDVVFFDAHSSLPYGEAVKVMDLARGAGAVTVGIVTAPLVPETQNK